MEYITYTSTLVVLLHNDRVVVVLIRNEKQQVSETCARFNQNQCKN